MNVNSNLYLLTAFGGGVISFLSPCVLPMVPGYLSLVTGLSVGEVAHRAGFSDPLYFSRAFKRHAGEAPSDFRAAVRGKSMHP